MTIAFMASGNTGGDRLKEIRKALRMTQDEFASALRVSGGRTSYKNYEYGTPPPLAMIKEAEALYQRRTAGRLAVTPDQPSKHPGFAVIAQTPMVEVKVVGTVSAGAGISEFFDAPTVHVPSNLLDGITDPMAHVVEGDSMMPWLQPGDVLIARPMLTPRLNRPFIVRTRDNELRVKLLAYEQDRWVERSMNPKYGDQDATDQLVGLVTGLYREDDGTTMILSNLNGLKPPRS